jgi:signal transduction histidine kinase/ActR/RegA family two-component response regulator
MSRVDGHTLDTAVWRPALEKYAGAAHLTVTLCGADGEVVCGPINPTALFALFAQSRDDHRLFTECTQRCLRETQNRTPVVATNRPGFGVVGTSLVLNGQIVGAVVAGYELLRFPEHLAMERFARDVGIAFPRLWQTVQREAPVSRQRLLFQGELLQVLGDTLLMENYRTRQHEELSAQLRAANVAKDRFLAVLSHELRTPLTAVLGWAQLLRTGHLSETARDRAMASIERNAQSQIRLIEDLLDISRIVAGTVRIDLQPLALDRIVEAAIETVAPTARSKGIGIDSHLQPGTVRGDPTRLQQVVVNLLSNAIKFTPSGGGVSVRLVRRDSDMELAVSDTGQGIKPEFLPLVFDPFQQGDPLGTRQHGGLGLGLAIAHHLLGMQSGSIEAESAGEGQGATFVVRLPLMSETATSMAPIELPAEANPRTATPSLGDLRVLVVEDNTDTREWLEEALLEAGAEVTAVGTANDAITALNDALPDVLVGDINLPDENGYALMQRIRKRADVAGGQIPAIALTADGSSADRERALAAGYQLHLAKPVSTSQLIGAIASLARPTLQSARPTSHRM